MTPFCLSVSQKPLFFIAIFCLSTALASRTHAANSETDSQIHLIIGVEDIRYFPLWEQRNNNFEGFARDYFDAFAKQYGYKVTYRPLPIKRLYKEFYSGRLDIKFPDNPKWRHEDRVNKTIYYSEGLIRYVDGVLTLSDNQSPAVLHRLGSVRGFAPWVYLDAVNKKELNLVESTDLSSLIRSLLEARIDGAYFNIMVAQHFLRKHFPGEDRIIFNHQLPFTEDHYLASSIKHPIIIQQLNAFNANKHLTRPVFKNFGLEEYQPDSKIIMPD